MIDRPADAIIGKVSREYDELIEACLVMVGFDKEYVIQHRDEFRRDIYPEGKCIFYHKGIPLFTVKEDVETDFENSTILVTHRISFRNDTKEK